MPESPRLRRSMMLVTGGDRALLDRTVSSDADIICMDLEDSVTDKEAARKLAASLLARPMRAEIAIRINPVSSVEGLQDLLMLRSMPVMPSLVKMTRVIDPYEVRLAGEILPDTGLVVIIETAEGLEQASAIAKASKNVVALSLGGKDLSKTMGCDRDWQGLLFARGRLVQAAATAGVRAFDEPYRPLDDLDGLREHCRNIAAMGFSGKTTVDLRHIPIINDLLGHRAMAYCSP